VTTSLIAGARRSTAPFGKRLHETVRLSLVESVMRTLDSRPILTVFLLSLLATLSSDADERPNILLAIGDDISWHHMGAYGSEFLDTPTFDQLADQGVVFNNAYCSAPGCSPSRAALLTGKYIWEIEEAGTHAANFPKRLKVYPELLESEGYFPGYTGKPWGPGRLPERDRNPAGPEYNNRTMDSVPAKGISNKDYASNFSDFLEARPKDKPFVFWYGAHEAHRVFEQGSGAKNGIDPASVTVPGFLPDTERTRHDVADYGLEIQWFDRHLGRMLNQLKKRGELSNTIVVVTADNGMAFPRAKANNYEYGVRMPLIVAWPKGIETGGRRIDDLVSLIDLAPTFLEAAGVAIPSEMSGRSLVPLLQSNADGKVDPTRNFVLSGRERHTHARKDNLGYPIRAIHTLKYNYIRNLHPERLPVGIEYKDVDASPSHSLMLANMDSKLSQLAYGPRPLEELYDRENDPYCLNNLATNPEYKPILDKLWGRLEQELRKGGDPRVLGYGEIFDSYPRYSSTRDYPGFKQSGRYNPEFVRIALEKMKALGIGNPGYEARAAYNKTQPSRGPSKK